MINSHTPILISAILRVASLYPLSVIFLSVFRTYINKRHSINGLRPYRVMIILALMAAAFNQLLYTHSDIKAYFTSTSQELLINPALLLVNGAITLSSYLFTYYLFVHASKKDHK